MKAWSKEFVGAFQRWYAARPRYRRTERLDLIGNSAVTIRDYGTIVHKHKLVLELTQKGFPTNHPPRWLALYGYLQMLPRKLLALKVNTTYRWYWVLGKIFWLNCRRSQYILSKTLGCRRTFGWGRKVSSNIVVCKYQKLASKIAWQPKLVVF